MCPIKLVIVTKGEKPKTGKTSPAIKSSSSEDFSDSDLRDDEDSEDFSIEDHAFLVSSVANLCRREIMQYKPLETKSEKTPRIKE